jgi:RND family efflux transporter MFP subunit
MKRRAKLLLPLGILAVGALGVALILWMREPVESAQPEIPAPLVRVQRVEPRPFVFVVRAHGTVTPRTESDLIPQVSGPVVWVSPALASGGFFEEGEPLVRIDTADYKVALESANAAVARGKSEYERAEKELERQQRLAKQSVASAARYDDAVNAEGIAAAALREARAKLERAERDLDRTEIRAPYAGRVREENVDPGQFVTRGSTIGRIYAVDYAEVRLPGGRDRRPQPHGERGRAGGGSLRARRGR